MLEKILRVSSTAWRWDQFILKEINTEYSLERLMLKLKLQYFGHLMGRAESLEKTLMLGKINGKRKRGQQRMRWLDGIIDWLNGPEFEQTLGDSEDQGSLACCSPWGHKELDTTYWLSNNVGILRESFYGFYFFLLRSSEYLPRVKELNEESEF